jgi:hypothetical protein
LEYSTHSERGLPAFVRNEFSNGGFIYKCRHREFDQSLGEKLARTICEIDVSSLTESEKRNVALGIFDLPFLLAAWREMCIQNGADAREYSRVMREMHSAVYDKMTELLVGTKTS